MLLGRPDVSDPTGDEPAPLSALLADRIAIEADDPALRLQRLEAALQEVDRQVEVREPTWATIVGPCPGAGSSNIFREAE